MVGEVAEAVQALLLHFETERSKQRDEILALPQVDRPRGNASPPWAETEANPGAVREPLLHHHHARLPLRGEDLLLDDERSPQGESGRAALENEPLRIAREVHENVRDHHRVERTRGKVEDAAPFEPHVAHAVARRDPAGHLDSLLEKVDPQDLALARAGSGEEGEETVAAAEVENAPRPRERALESVEARESRAPDRQVRAGGRREPRVARDPPQDAGGFSHDPSRTPARTRRRTSRSAALPSTRSETLLGRHSPRTGQDAR